MYSGFDIKLNSDFSEYKSIGDELFNTNKIEIQRELGSYFGENGKLDGSAIGEDWFPQIEADIFISHSHKNKEQAIALSGFLHEEFGIKAFIDSCVWGYSEQLQKNLDRAFCYREETDTYSYSKRNITTSHVHMMLSMALLKMIDKTECMFFLNTQQSITITESVSQTNSPWIYSEILFSQLVRKRDLKDYRENSIMKFALEEAYKVPDITYNVNLRHLVELKRPNFTSWQTNYVKSKGKKHPLDVLYEMVDNLNQ